MSAHGTSGDAARVSENRLRIATVVTSAIAALVAFERYAVIWKTGHGGRGPRARHRLPSTRGPMSSPAFAVPDRRTDGSTAACGSDHRPRIVSTRVAICVILLAALASLAGVAEWAPGYLTERGFPLDDAWIHAVYGRELARSGMLAYNPGTPATGSTAPLWSAIVAVPHLLTSGAAIVWWMKLSGFVFHALTALVLFAALRDDEPAHDPWRLAGAVLVALHPDVVSASVSGMEVSLAALAAAMLLEVAAHGGPLAYAGVAALAYLARPELAVVSLSLPLLAGAGRRGRGVRLACGAAAGTALAFGVLAAHNLAASGLPLPATFYAKVAQGTALPAALRMGFAGLLRQLPLVNSPLLLGATFGIAVVLLRSSYSRALVTAAAGYIAGLIFCAVSFTLIAPVDPEAFYHQRYVLPALPLLVCPLPLLLHEALARSVPARSARIAATAIVALFFVLLMRGAPARYAHLANDARNIDDVQVALGRSLAGAAPSDVVWAIDAGAVRYFGNAFVVDMMGLNTPEVLGEQAQAFLDAHPPRYVEVVPSWSSLNGGSSARYQRVLFEPTTPYTVTGFSVMQRHWLVQCETGEEPARFDVRTRTFTLTCAPRDDTRLAAQPSLVRVP